METRWELQDSVGTTISLLPNADSRRLSFRLKDGPEASVTLGLDDPDAILLRDILQYNGIPILQVHRIEDSGPVLRHRGFIAPEAISEEMSDTNTVTFVSSPLARLEGRQTPDIRAFDNVDAGTIATTLVDEARTGWPDPAEPTSETGIRSGTIQASYATSPVYERRPLIDAIKELADANPGFDWELRPVDEGAVVARLDVYARKGTARNARFAKGDGTIDNCQRVGRARERLRNRVIVIGDLGVTKIVSDPASIAFYGLWQHIESMPDQIDATILETRARQLLTSPIAKEVIELTPEPERAPIPLVDYDIGDTVQLYARVRNNAGDDYDFSGVVRVEGIDITYDSDGNESAHTLQVTPPVDTELAPSQPAQSSPTVGLVLFNRFSSTPPLPFNP